MGSRRIKIKALFVFTALLAASVACAEEPVETRLLIGDRQDGGDLLQAGISISLEPGWKTYWKNPGESGLPPRLDWSGSENVATITTLWPVPQRFKEHGAIFYGYTARVVWPVEVRVKDPTRHVKLRLTMDYAVCATLCVPKQARFDRDILPAYKSAAFDAALIGSYKARVPVADGSVTAQVEPVSRDAEAALRVRLTLPPDSGEVTVLVDDPQGKLGVPQQEASGGHSYLIPCHTNPCTMRDASLVVAFGNKAVEVPLNGAL